VSLSWLRDYVDFDVTPEQLGERLNLSGTKLETITRPAADVRGVVVAEVLAIEDHPGADNLTLVEVSAGEGHSQRVVCGARNFRIGDRVPLATVGARLPGGVEIAERKIRGQSSAGMLCSAMELGISKDHSGILVLPPDAPLGADVVSVLGLDDAILELEITPNRGDCLSMIGIAREVAALLGTELRLPDATVPAASVDSPVVVRVEDTQGCPRYLARYMEDVSVRPSPVWLVARLLAAGIRPISNVVDVTNYVLLETGHPLHAFDAAKVAQATIVVRRAEDGELLRTLDGVERKLVADDLVIADPERAIALAGVMGGEGTEVSRDTEAVILESALFDHASIAYSARRHGLRTEASMRFERRADPENVPFAAGRAARLLAEIAYARVAPEVTDVYPVEVRRARITLRPERTKRLLGIDIPAEAQAGYLRALGLEVTTAPGRIDVVVPTFRPDLEREADLVEEVARLAGFDLLPSTLPPGAAGALTPAQAAVRRCARLLAGMGLQEAWTTSFASPAELDALGLSPDHPARVQVALMNPMTEDATTLRTTLLPGLLRSAARNVARRVPDVALFEIASVYEPSERELPAESQLLAAAFCGARQLKSWRAERKEWDLFSVKGVVEALLRALRIGGAAFEPYGARPFHPTRAARLVLAGEPVGVLGELHPETCDAFDVPQGTAAFELALEPLIAACPGKPVVEEPPRLPGVYFDLAFIVDRAVPAGRIEEVVRLAGRPEVVSVRLFDVYEGEQLGEGRKSIAFALELRAPDRTLTDDEAAAVRARIVRAVAERTGAELRG
jgi:phenylalanyl-tRNA synthetase beta chain